MERQLLAKILKKENLIFTKLVRHNKVIESFIAEKNGQKVFVKVSTRLEGKKRLINEVKANEFILKIKPKSLLLKIPKSQLIQRSEYTLAIFEYYLAQPFVSEKKLKFNFLPNESDLKCLAEIAQFYDEIPRAEIPNYFSLHAKLFSEYENQFKENLFSVEEKCISKKEVKQALENWVSFSFEKRFQHHDFVLWNMLKDEKGWIVLTDAEFSRYGFRFYDLAYYFIQTYTLLDQVNLARKSLSLFLKNFKIKDIEKQFFLPLLYRVSVNLAELKGEKNLIHRTLMLFQEIMKFDLQLLLRG